jgi:hypothetical protein
MMVLHYFWGLLLCGILFVTGKHRLIQEAKFDNFLLLITLFYSILGLLQYYNYNISSFFLVLEYDWGGERQRTIQEVFEHTNTVTGTMFRMANFGNLMALIINYLVAKKLKGRLVKKSLLFYSAIILGCIVITLTGIRTSLAALIFGLLLNAFLFRRKETLKVAMFMAPILIYLLPLLVSLGTVSIGEGVQTENPLLRVAGLFYLFSGDADLSNVTLIRSINIFEVVRQNPIFGVGTFFRTGYPGVDSPTDAFLLFHITELGILGFALLLYPYYWILKYFKKIDNKSFKVFLVLISILTLQTITDNGLFYLVANMLFWIMISVNLKGGYRLIYKKL